MKKEKQEEKKETLMSDFERTAKEQYVPLSDGSEIRVLSFNQPMSTEKVEVVLIAGMMSIFPRWEKVVKELHENCTVHYVESREKYTSRLVKRRANMKITRLARDLIEVEKFLKLDKQNYVTISSSLGGAVVLEALATQEFNPVGSILIGPGTELNFPKWVPPLMYFLPPFTITMLKPLIRWYFRNILVDSKAEPLQAREYVRALNEADIRKVRRCVLTNYRYKGWNILPKVTNRTLLVGATKDKLHESDFTFRVGKVLPNCTFVDLGTNKATHDSPIVELTKEFIQELIHGGPKVGINPKKVEFTSVEST